MDQMAILPSLTHRHLQPEVMDQPNLDGYRHRHALRGLGRINFWSGSAGVLWGPLAGLARELGRALRVLDLASGGGDVPIRLARRARRTGVPLYIAGCDVSPVAVAHATQQARQRGSEVAFFVMDTLSEALPTGYDVLMSSLFLHHLNEEQAELLLRKMADAAGNLVLINDLVRSRMGLLLAHAGTRLLTLSPVVHVDGPRSVAAAFTAKEVHGLAVRAGMGGATVVRRWPCRFLLSWRKM